MQKIIISFGLLLLLIIAGSWMYRSHESSKEIILPQQLVGSASYQCDEGNTIQVEYYQGNTTPAKEGEQPVPNGSVVLTLTDGSTLTVPQTISASGIRYATVDESFVFWSKGDTAFVEEDGQQTYVNCVEASESLSQDIYPLYDALRWETPAAEEVNLGTSTFSGISLAALPVVNTMDPASVFVPFEEYYAQKLAALGWEADIYLAAGGPMGGQSGYRNGSQIILTRYDIAPQHIPEDAPSECPCDVTPSLFIGEPIR